jgi:hypothetical protein
MPRTLLALMAAVVLSLSAPPIAAFGADTCEVTLETIVPASEDGSDLTPWTQLSAPARHDLVQTKTPWAMSGQVRLASKQTIPFPPPGEVRIFSVPWSWVTAIELRHLAGQRPDWLMLDRRGALVGGPPMQCPPTGFEGLAEAVSKDRFLELTVHPPGPIQVNRPRPQYLDKRSLSATNR